MLKLTTKKLLQIGFKKKVLPKDKFGKRRVVYEIKGKANDKIYYNPKEEVYTWYYCTEIQGVYNHINLDIEKVAELLLVLQIFNFKFKF